MTGASGHLQPARRSPDWRQSSRHGFHLLFACVLESGVLLLTAMVAYDGSSFCIVPNGHTRLRQILMRAVDAFSSSMCDAYLMQGA